VGIPKAAFPLGGLAAQKLRREFNPDLPNVTYRSPARFRIRKRE